MDERERRSDRQRSVRAASIILGDGTPDIPCVVLDRSAGGVRLHVHDPALVPDNFRLLILEDNSEHACAVIWRTGNEIGVQFQA